MFKASSFSKIPRSVIIKLVISVLIWIVAVVVLVSGKNWAAGSGGSRVIVIITGILIFMNVYNTLKKYKKDES